jgi:hypothetical protein
MLLDSRKPPMLAVAVTVAASVCIVYSYNHITIYSYTHTLTYARLSGAAGALRLKNLKRE